MKGQCYDPELLEWNNIETNTPCRFNVWRGVGQQARLGIRLRESLGRETLLGQGIYLAPSKRVAGQYGVVSQYEVTLFRPYVVICPRRPPYPSYIGPIKELDFLALIENHDGVVLKECIGYNREDMRQVLVFPQYSHQILPVSAIINKPQKQDILEEENHQAFKF